MSANKKTIRAYIWKSPNGKHLDRAMWFNVVAKNGNQESLEKDQLVIVYDKDDKTGKVKIALAKGIGTTAKKSSSFYWPAWKPSSNTILVHKVKFITRKYDLPSGFFQRKYLTQTNMHTWAKNKIVKWISSNLNKTKSYLEDQLK